jgi:hypothetical protein
MLAHIGKCCPYVRSSPRRRSTSSGAELSEKRPHPPSSHNQPSPARAPQRIRKSRPVSWLTPCLWFSSAVVLVAHGFPAALLALPRAAVSVNPHESEAGSAAFKAVKIIPHRAHLSRLQCCATGKTADAPRQRNARSIGTGETPQRACRDNPCVVFGVYHSRVITS